MSSSQQGPIAQQLQKIQSNGQQALTPAQLSNAQTTPIHLSPKQSKMGFADKTLWDWLNLMAVLLVPLMIGVFTIATTVQQNQISQQQFQQNLGLSQKQHDSDQKIAAENRQKDIQIATDQQQQATLESYLDRISNLMLNNHLSVSKGGDEVRTVAQVWTLATLRQLDPVRKGILIRFLFGANLIIVSNSKVALSKADYPIIDLRTADLKNIDLRDLFLRGMDLHDTILNNADLSYSVLNFDDISISYLVQANLSNALLFSADLYESDLTGANLTGADLHKANLTGARVTPEQLAQAYSLQGATLPDGSTYPSKSYPIPNHTEP
jgi:uncharacterized protein YjbI with pentapeptide repeats